MNTIDLFVECWKEFETAYRLSHVLSDVQGDGTPSVTIWCEADIQFRLASLFANRIGKNGHDWVHLEVPMGEKSTPRVDLIFSDPQITEDHILEYLGLDFKQLYRIFRVQDETSLKFDLGVELGIVKSTDRTSQSYGQEKVRNDLDKLSKLVEDGKIESGIVCMVDKADNPDHKFWEDTEYEYIDKVKLLAIVGN